ncbi:MAG: hypothetical protein M3297_00885 [Thermoproteota archaeon]|jgi:hypothetical protein|nr:hypothetical protein [Thermoproteota archaeon]
MTINNNAKIMMVIGIVALVASLSMAYLTSLTQQQAGALSKYDIMAGETSKGRTDQAVQQNDLGNNEQPSTTAPTLPTIPTANCAMDTIESLESFLSCLGAK